MSEEANCEALLQPLRFKLATHIANAPEALYLDQLATLMGENPRLVAHHLEILEDLGLVSSRFRIIRVEVSDRGFAGRFFQPTPKLRKALEGIAQMALSRRKPG